MNMSYRKAGKGETTCEECRYSRVRAVSNRIECQYFTSPYYAVGRKYTCDRVALRGAK